MTLPRNLLLLAEDDSFAYRILSAAHATGARVHVLAQGAAAGLARSRFARSVTPVEGRFDDTAPEAMIAEINAVTARLAIDVVIPGNAPTTRFLIRVGDRLSARPLPAPDLVTFDRLSDKLAFGQLLERLGLPSPPGRLFADGETLARALLAGEASPLGMMKPLSECSGRGVRRVGGEDIDMVSACPYAPVLYQDFIEGFDAGGAAICRRGQVLGFIAWRRFRGGLTFLEPRELERQVARIAVDQCLTGVFNFDLRGDADLKRFHWLECNPRVFYTIELLAAAGLDVIALALALDGPETDAARAVFARRAAGLVGRRARTLRGLALDLARGRPPRALDVGMMRHRLSDPRGYLHGFLERFGPPSAPWPPGASPRWGSR